MTENSFPFTLRILPVPTGSAGELDYCVESKPDERFDQSHSIRLKRLLTIMLGKNNIDSVEVTGNGNQLFVRVRPADVVDGVQFRVHNTLRSIVRPQTWRCAVASRVAIPGVTNEFVLRVKLLIAYDLQEVTTLHDYLQNLPGVRESQLEAEGKRTVLLTIKGEWRKMRERFAPAAARQGIGLYVHPK